MSKRIVRRSIAVLLATVMTFTAVPVSSSAAEATGEVLDEASDESRTEAEGEAPEEKMPKSEEGSESETEKTEDRTETETVGEEETAVSEDSDEVTETEDDADSVTRDESTEVAESEKAVRAANNPYPYWQTFTYNGTQYKTITCTYYAWQQVYDNLGIALPEWGNAGTWLDSAKNSGYQTGTEPQARALAVWRSSGNTWGHVAYVTEVSNNKVTINEGGSVDKRRQDTVNGIYTGHVLPDGYTNMPDGYIYLSRHNPIGVLDEVRGGAGSITVRGWALDYDAPNQPLAIHVYIGGPSISGAPGYVIYADKERPDVGNAYPGTGNYHGFKETIATEKTGVQDVYVYAINAGEGDNSLIGTGTVTITDRNKGSYMETGYERVIPDGYYHIVSSFGDKWWLSISESSTADGGNVEVNDYSGKDFKCDEQLFYLQFIDDGDGRGFYKITNKLSGKCLDVERASEYMRDENGNPTNVQQWEDNGSSAQRWAIREVDGGEKGALYTFKARNSGFCLDLFGGEDNLNNDIRNISMYEDNESPAQLWRLVPYVLPKMAPPTPSIPSGSEVEGGTRIFFNGGGADEIYFTWDGSDPRTSPERCSYYGELLNIWGIPVFSYWETMTIKAYAIKSGYQDSDIIEITYTVKQNTSTGEEGGDTEGGGSTGGGDSNEGGGTTEGGGDSGEESDTNPEDDDLQDGVKWHYNEQNVAYRDLSQHGQITTTIKPKTYDGTPYKPAVKVTSTENGKTVTLTEGPDYRVLYYNNIHAGTGSVTVKGNGVYKGTISKTFEIKKKSCKKLKVVTNSMLTGDSRTPEVYVYDGNVLLKENKDYTIEGITSNLTATKGTKQISVRAAPDSDYEGMTTAKITVYNADKGRIKGIIDRPEDVNLSQNIYQYTGKACKPTAVVTVDGKVLTAGKDYTIKYQNNKDVGTAFVTIKGKGSYVGSIVKEFTIKPSSGEFTLKKQIAAVTYNGKLKKPKITVRVNGKTLKLNKDYTLSYTNNLHATDRAKVTVRGKGNYADASAKVFYFTINPCHIKKASVKGGQGSLIITHAKHTLVEGVDYDVIYGAAAGKGKISVTIKAKEGSSFTGEVTKKVKQ